MRDQIAKGRNMDNRRIVVTTPDDTQEVMQFPINSHPYHQCLIVGVEYTENGYTYRRETATR